MDDKRKIVLGSEDILIKGVKDIFLNINLQQTFNQIKKERYDNNFDLSKQFRKERNESRDFRIYGIVDSTITDSDNLIIEVYKNSGLTDSIGTINTTPLVYSEQNVFSKKRGKYLLELNNYDEDVVYFKILGDNVTYGNQVFSQRLVFYTLDGDFVEYGTETIDIGLNNQGFLEIENNFPFFYNKHWIKKDFEIIEEKPTQIQFELESSNVSEGNSISIDIIMDKPSPFGNESVTLDAVLGTILPNDFNLSISGSPITFPVILDWSQGEQNKTLTFDAITDTVNEFSENLRFDLYNFQFTNSGLTTTHYVTIDDATPRKKTIYNLGPIYKNRIQFTGRTSQSISNGPIVNSSAYSILRNGLHFSNSNEEFYPGDTYTLAVTNFGIDTILPINSNFNINTEQLWPAGETKFFNLDTDYSGTEKHKVKLDFPLGNPHNLGQIRINGVNIPIALGALNYANVAAKILDNSNQDYLPSVGLEKDWSAIGDGISAITITSKTTGLPVKIDIIETSASGGFPSTGAPNPLSTPVISEIDPYIERAQVNKKLVLYANNNSNTSTLYDFKFIKPGYIGMYVAPQMQAATISGVNRYLITQFKYVSRNWNSTENDCIYSTAATPNVGSLTTVLGNGTPNQTNYYHPVGGAYINGSVLLSSNSLPGSKLNYTTIEKSEFKNNPLIVEPCTNELLLTHSISQLTKIIIPTIGQSNEANRVLYDSNCNGFRSFDFRYGTSGPFTTFYKDNVGFYNSNDIKWGSQINVSGATSGSIGTLSQRLDYGYSPTIMVGPVSGLNANNSQLAEFAAETTIYLESKVQGVPFQIINVVNAYVESNASGGSYGPTLVAGNTIGPIVVDTIRESGVVGVDLNKARNWMGGYNTTLQIGPGGFVTGTTVQPSVPPVTSVL